MSDFEPTGEHPLVPGGAEPDEWREPETPPPPWYQRPGAMGVAVAGVVLLIAIAVTAAIALNGDSDDEVSTAEPTPSLEPTAEPTLEPTAAPTETAEPEATPASDDQAVPVGSPTPIATPTVPPTAEPTAEPTVEPTVEPTAVPDAACSADGLDAVQDQLDLPGPVADERRAIAQAALGCDIDALVARTDADFTASFGGGQPGEVWAGNEAAGGEPLRWLVDMLRLPYGTLDPVEGDDAELLYVWPSAHSFESWDDVPRTDRQALLDVYAPEDLDQFEAFGAYTGYRVGITESGRWIFFVAGD